ncbi:GDSL esterase/lipase-like protein [Drosera capensis]
MYWAAKLDSVVCVQGSSNCKHTKLFAFGDSYADTGNTPRSLPKFTSSPWAAHGISFPGTPDGRFSDGFVFTDYLAGEAASLHIYRSWKLCLPGLQLSGNDYAKLPDLDGVVAFIGKVVAQLVVNIRRVYSMGVKQVLVSGLQPLGCLPLETRSTNYTVCKSLINVAVGVRNGLLQQAVTQLNSETEESYTPFILLDMYDTFMIVINNHTGDANFGNPLELCCSGINSTYSCASYTDDGAKLYSLCESRKSRFLWDTFHPTNEGWNVVSSLLHDRLGQLQPSHTHK